MFPLVWHFNVSNIFHCWLTNVTLYSHVRALLWLHMVNVVDFLALEGVLACWWCGELWHEIKGGWKQNKLQFGCWSVCALRADSDVLNNKRRKLQREKQILGTHQQIKTPPMLDALLYYCVTTEEEQLSRINGRLLHHQQHWSSLIPDGGPNLITVVGYLMR